MHSWLCSYIAQLGLQEIIITTVLDNEMELALQGLRLTALRPGSGRECKNGATGTRRMVCDKFVVCLS